MSDDFNYVEDWDDESTQCKNCVSFQSQDGRNACVPKGASFERALDKYGQGCSLQPKLAYRSQIIYECSKHSDTAPD